MASIPWSPAELRSMNAPEPKTGRALDQIAFPLGGLGTGMVSLGGWGQLRDWEIRNRPAKGAAMPQGFFMLRCRNASMDVTRVLQGPLGNGYSGNGHSLGHDTGQGLPHFRHVSFDGRFPIAQVRLTDPSMPLEVELEAFNPFIPLNDKDSGIPCAILVYRLHNPTEQSVEAHVFGNLTNLIGDPKTNPRVNRERRAAGLTGLELSVEQMAADDPTIGSLVLASPLSNVTVVPRWPQQAWFAALDHYWQACALEAFPPHFRNPGGARTDTGTIGVNVLVAAGTTVDVPIILAWHFPHVKHWKSVDADGVDRTPGWLNWYATQWTDAWDVTRYVAEHYPRLRRETHEFRDTLFRSTVPTAVLDAVSSQISILKSPTVMRLTDGTFYGFEGCSDNAGCCEGSCTHVWNYAQALPYLFPNLQRSMREADWRYSLLDDGYDTFRMPLPLGTKADPNFHPAADGQMGTVMQTYREWMVSGDDGWLHKMWPKAQKALEFAWKYWDADQDGVMEGMQHNTYDIEYYGPNTMMGSLYLGALRAGAAMARQVGDLPTARKYEDLVERGSAWTDANLFNGEYFEQHVEPEAWRDWPQEWRERSIDKYGYDSQYPDWPKWQVGKGCLSDQLIGQWYAEMLGLGKLYDQQHVQAALRAIFEHNWKPDLHGHPNPMRIYAVGDEAGLLLCTWPQGGRPGHPSVYGDEVWCGIEYQVAAHMIYEGLVDEGLAIVKGLRDRYDGVRRNPWDEIECGHHYVRSMASYSLLLALSGFRYHAGLAQLTLQPKFHANPFRTFFSTGSGWGELSYEDRPMQALLTIRMHTGELPLASVVVPGSAKSAQIGDAEARLRPSSGQVEALAAWPQVANPNVPLQVVFRR